MSAACSGSPRTRCACVSPYVGGAFGSGLRPQYQLFLAVMAAQELKRSVRVVLTREQMFTFGHRPETVQQLSLGAAATAPAGDRARGGRRYLAVRGLHRGRRQLVGPALPVRQCHGSTTSWRSSTVYTPLRHARARCDDRGVRARDRRWTSWPAARRRSARAAAHELRRDRPERGQAVHQQGTARLLRAGRGAVRLVAAQAAAALDARRPRPGRLGHGDRRLGGACRCRPPRQGRAHGRRQARGRHRHRRHRHRHLHRS